MRNSRGSEKTHVVSQHVGQEVHHDAVLPGILLTQGADGLHHHHLT